MSVCRFEDTGTKKKDMKITSKAKASCKTKKKSEKMSNKSTKVRRKKTMLKKPSCVGKSGNCPKSVDVVTISSSEDDDDESKPDETIVISSSSMSSSGDDGAEAGEGVEELGVAIPQLHLPQAQELKHCIDIREERALEDQGSDKDKTYHKRYLHDKSFVLSKFMVHRKLKFSIDDKIRISRFEKKVRKLLVQADILQLRASLGEEVEIYHTSGQKLMMPSLQSEEVKQLAKPKPQPIPIENEKTDFLHTGGPDQMPVISMDHNSIKPQKIKLNENKPAGGEENKSDASELSSAGLLRRKVGEIPKPRRLTPPVKFPRIKTKSFKIPKAKKLVPSWVKNGKCGKSSLTSCNFYSFVQESFGSLQ